MVMYWLLHKNLWMESCNTCASETDHKKKPVKAGTSLLGSLLVIILPKCGLFVMAYSSAIAVCGAPSLTEGSTDVLSFVPWLLSLVVLTMIALNRRGIRTLFAFLTALLGTVIIILSHQHILLPEYYQYGAVMLFLGVWMNGSLMAFLSWMQNLWSPRKSAEPIVVRSEQKQFEKKS